MKKLLRKWINLIAIVLVISIIFIGCTAAQKPAPEPRDQPDPTVTDNLADRVTALSQQVKGVDKASAVVVGNIAIIGIDVSERSEGDRSEQIKNAVAKKIESDNRIAEAYVTADPDLFKRIRNIADGIAQGKPISQFLEEITDLLKEIRPQS